MKKMLTLGCVFFILLSLCACESVESNYSHEESTIETVVVNCEQGAFHPDPTYLSLANMYYTQGNYGLWVTNMNLANANGKYDYLITITIDGVNYNVTREAPYAVGQTISITRVDTYKDSKLVNTEYK